MSLTRLGFLSILFCSFVLGVCNAASADPAFVVGDKVWARPIDGDPNWYKGKIVRETPAGFAIRFKHMGDYVNREMFVPRDKDRIRPLSAFNGENTIFPRHRLVGLIAGGGYRSATSAYSRADTRLAVVRRRTLVD